MDIVLSVECLDGRAIIDRYPGSSVHPGPCLGRRLSSETGGAFTRNGWRLSAVLCGAFQPNRVALFSRGIHAVRGACLWVRAVPSGLRTPHPSRTDRDDPDIRQQGGLSVRLCRFGAEGCLVQGPSPGRQVGRDRPSRTSRAGSRGWSLCRDPGLGRALRFLLRPLADRREDVRRNRFSSECTGRGGRARRDFDFGEQEGSLTVTTSSGEVVFWQADSSRLRPGRT